MKRVLFLCTQNSCRSQMAEGIVNELLKGKVHAKSAGVDPCHVHPTAIEVLKEIGIDISLAQSKHVKSFDGQSFDLVVTVCERAKKNCPLLPGQGKKVHFGLPDPAVVKGTFSKKITAFRQVRETIVKELVPFLVRHLGIGV